MRHHDPIEHQAQFTGTSLRQPPQVFPRTHVQWGQYIFDPLANYENWLLVEKGTKYKFTHLFI